jgi:hypothetical protein
MCDWVELWRVEPGDLIGIRGHAPSVVEVDDITLANGRWELHQVCGGPRVPKVPRRCPRTRSSTSSASPPAATHGVPAYWAA